jgi:hypothetical protein
MIKTPIRLQDLRRRIYVKAKADTFCGFRSGNVRTSVGDDGVGTGCTTPCGCSVAVGLNHLFRKSFRLDRSHKLWDEANRKAQCGKSARWV